MKGGPRFSPARVCLLPYVFPAGNPGPLFSRGPWPAPGVPAFTGPTGPPFLSVSRPSLFREPWLEGPLGELPRAPLRRLPRSFPNWPGARIPRRALNPPGPRFPGRGPPVWNRLGNSWRPRPGMPLVQSQPGNETLPLKVPHSLGANCLNGARPGNGLPSWKGFRNQIWPRITPGASREYRSPTIAAQGCRLTLPAFPGRALLFQPIPVPGSFWGTEARISPPVGRLWSPVLLNLGRGG